MQSPPGILDVILERLNHVIKPVDEFVPLHVPEFHGEERAFVNDCIDTGWVSSVGSYVDTFEHRVASTCEVSHGVAVVNGTAALQVALIVAGVKPGDEVLMPTLTFVATANAVHHIGAVPHFLDSEPYTLGLDPAAMERHLRSISTSESEGLINRQTGRRISCVVPMHAFGHPVDMRGLVAVAEEFQLVIVEDAAEALGSRCNGRACGSFGRTAALSFNGNKIITTGGGGAIVTDDVELAQRAKHLTTTAKVTHPWAFDHDEVGYNYRMPNLNAAIGVAQLDQLKTRLEMKRRLASRYIAAFEGLDCARIFSEPKFARSNYWLNAMVLESSTTEAERNTLLDGLNSAGYMARPVWTLMHRLPFHDKCPRAILSVAEDLERRIINLPSSACLADRV